MEVPPGCPQPQPLGGYFRLLSFGVVFISAINCWANYYLLLLPVFQVGKWWSRIIQEYPEFHSQSVLAAHQCYLCINWQLQYFWGFLSYRHLKKMSRSWLVVVWPNTVANSHLVPLSNEALLVWLVMCCKSKRHRGLWRLSVGEKNNAMYPLSILYGRHIVKIILLMYRLKYIMKLNFTGVCFKNEATREFQIICLADICSSFILLLQGDNP